ncbi:DUF3114 domain-containing protein [Streptococcus sp. 20-1249]|uniref:DUF3114 domain-containing protein n=1 Tax=Streptococcus hepaticus TaxID=3349163 RepID=UPI003748692A
MKKEWILLITLIVFGIGMVAGYFFYKMELKDDKSASPFKYIRQLPTKKALEQAPQVYATIHKALMTAEEQEKVTAKLTKHIKNLQELGWSNQAIWKGYLYQMDRQTKTETVGSYLDQRFAETKNFGSTAYTDLWRHSGYKKSAKSARALLEKAMELVGMPEDLSGQPKETQKLIATFDDQLEPDDNFWKYFSNTVQVAFPKNTLADEQDILARKIHQFRYVISSQQAQWVRLNYKKQGMTDAQALAIYMKDMDEMNSFLEEAGIVNSDYYYDYNYGESARLHNKVAVTIDGTGLVKIHRPDNINQVNFKIVMDFYSEFILDEAGNFLNEIDAEKITENGVVNGASYNYANENNALHRTLDVKPIRVHDPEFRKNFSEKTGLHYRTPNSLKSPEAATQRQKWENSYFNPKGNFAIDNQSASQRVKDSIQTFQKLVEEAKKTNAQVK